jgi:hypothetical protein
MQTIVVGWPATPLPLVVYRGSSGPLRIAPTILKTNGDPLDSYDGWADATLKVARAGAIGGTNDRIDLTSAVTGDALTHRLIMDFPFLTAVTKDLDLGFYTGKIVMTDPDGEEHKLCDINLQLKD